MSRGSLSMQALQRADKLLGPPVCLALQPLRWLRRRHATGTPRRILMIKFWGIGSLQLLTPAAQALRERHPDAELALLTLSQNRECATHLAAFDRVLCVDVGGCGWVRMFRRILELCVGLRRERFDEVYDFEFFTRFSAVVSVLTGAGRKHGFGSTSVWRGGFHDRLVPFNRYWHVSRNFRVLAGGENGRSVGPDELRPIAVEQEHERQLDAVLERHGIDADAPLCVLNPNAGTLSLERRWPRPMFADLGRALAEEHGFVLCLIGSRSEREYTARVHELLGAERDVVNLAGELDTVQLAALLGRAELCISNDSGPMHLAAALGTRTIGLFGPETPLMYEPLGARARALYQPPACSPCINVHDNKVSSCVYGFPQCLVNIGVGDVLEQARDLLGAGQTIAPAARRDAPHARKPAARIGPRRI